MKRQAKSALWLALILASASAHAQVAQPGSATAPVCPSEQVDGQHSASTLTQLGDAAMESTAGGPDTLLRALALYREAALCGDALAGVRLAGAYLSVHGSRFSDAAVQLYELAAAQGIRDAYVPLANLYYFGNHGVAVNYPRAKALYELAAQFDDGLALNNLGDLYEMGRGVAVDYVQARALYERSAAAGESMGFASLASLLSDGKGVARHPVLGLAYAEYAAMLDKDSTFIANIRRDLRGTVTSEERNQASALADAWRKDGAPARLPVPMDVAPPADEPDTGQPAPQQTIPAG
ncbi:tetratricopeptide repeat protein [Pseudoduganella chitinolytica]|uniref:Tetratricopeptide repeat protein n=1 Tax=Pseudoduganella chitinolytica TaxID=34070 RepID=A0ABY8BJ79_9BURK|nr:tetratricopeptide repeat protein [Pseudoduganella chitinolytica]WEF34732.1 tetratricopeptide repeat protein [Pseudoduganella chitinolytica]